MIDKRITFLSNINFLAARSFVGIANIFFVSMGFIALVSHLPGAVFLNNIFPILTNIQFNTALGFFFAGLSLWFLRDEERSTSEKRIGKALAVVPILLGLFAFREYDFSARDQIDLFISFRGGMSQITAVCFVLSGLNLFFLGRKKSSYFSLVVIFLSIFECIVYIFNHELFNQLLNSGFIVLHPPVTFLLLSLLILIARPSSGMMMIVSNTLGGKVIRFLLPSTILLTLGVGVLVEWGESLGFFNTHSEAVVLLVLLILIYSPLIYFLASRINTFEHELAENETRYRQAITAANAIPYSLDYEPRRYSFMGAGIDQMTGYPADEFSPQLLDTLIQESIMQGEFAGMPITEAVKQIRSGKAGLFWSCDHRIRTRRGEERWFSDSSIQILDENDIPKGSVGIFQDITDRKKIEQEVQHNEHILRLFVENSPAAIAMFDRNMRYIVVSRRFLQDYELGDQNLIGRSHYEVFPEIPERWKEIHKRCLAGAIEKADEDPFPRADGRMDWIRWQIHPWYETDGDIGGIIIFSEVITEYKIAQEKLHAQFKKLNDLSDIDKAITGGVDIRLSLNTLVEKVVSQLKADAACVWTFNPTMLTMDFVSGYGFRPSFLQHAQLKLHEGYAGRSIMERKINHIPNLKDATAKLSHARLLADENFVDYYAIPLIAKGQVKGVLELFHRTAIQTDEDWFDFLETLGHQAAIAIDNAQLFDGLQRSNNELTLAYDAAIEGWSAALDLRDKETEGHSRRVTDMAVRLALDIGVDQASLVHIRRGALLHDIGKLGIPDQILLKSDELTSEEWAIMRKHPTYGYELLKSIYHLQPALDIPYCHHEKWDGSGYPRGLKGEQIPFAARIFAVVDVWDALTNDRPYRAKWTEEKALEYIKKEAGKHFDPKIVNAFVKMMNK